ncbi:MAG: YgiQ family radical SAM protein, partial [Firmicutes bacterium]|nr:YgiQ family radical SAM protein [Bacillota bacterium]
MVNHYTVNKKPRSSDSYTPGGKAGKRPNYATAVYCNLIKQRFKGAPVIIGGIEASLRRLAHYDYWSDRLKRSILLDSGADLLLYGMGELSIVETADALNSGLDISDITFVNGSVYKTRDPFGVADGIMLPEFSALEKDKLEYAKSFYIQYQNAGYATAKPLIEKYGENRYIVQNPPQRPLTTLEMDDVYELPYMNAYHPSYEKEGGVPAIKEIKFSLTSNRGCFGACSFCALTFHQGRIVQVRSHESLIREAEAMTKDPDFKGYIHDVGGPTADFRRPSCDKQLKHGVCKDRQCLFPRPCPNLKAEHADYISLLRKLRAIKGVKKVFIRSGIRFDYVLADKKGDAFIEEICRYHVSGQLRVAPEHVSDNVLRLMGKPENSVYKEFIDRFDKTNERLGLDQYAVPYLISSHPGSTLKDAVALAESVRDMGYMPEQVQDFYPTPSTISTVMYYTGVDPRTMEKVYVPSSPREKAMQRALIQYRKPENYELVKEALIKAGRQDLIGWDRKHCLIAPRQTAGERAKAGSERSKVPGGRPKDTAAKANTKAGKPEKKPAGRPSAKPVSESGTGQGPSQKRGKNRR